MVEAVRKRRGRERRKSDRSKKKAALRLPYLQNRMKFQEVLDEEGLARIHNASMQILEDIGIAFRDEAALEQWRKTGATVADDHVYPDRGMIMELVGKAPEKFAMASRNPERAVEIGGRNSVFIPMQGAPYVRDLDGIRRESTLEDLQNFNKITQMSSCYHLAAGFVVEANDLPVPHRHLEWVKSNLVHTDMPFFGDYIPESQFPVDASPKKSTVESPTEGRFYDDESTGQGTQGRYQFFEVVQDVP